MCAVKGIVGSAAHAAGLRKGNVRAFVLSAAVICVATSLLWLGTLYVRRMADRFLLEIFTGRVQ
jgi:hypothetical protein